jgi:hypothetical protein
MTRSLRIAVPVVLATLVALPATHAVAQTASQKAFDAIKTLPGTWEGKSSKGDVQVTFKLASGGSAVMSEIDHEDMISMFHMDGPDRLLLTHYCAIGNQPRMQAAVSPDGKVITFTYFDATNLSAPDAGHMQQMILTIVDDRHHIEEWVFQDHGKEMREVFDLRRKT